MPSGSHSLKSPAGSYRCRCFATPCRRVSTDIDSELVQILRTAYEEWLDSQQGLKANPEMHRLWVTWVLLDLLDMDKTLKDAQRASRARRHRRRASRDFAPRLRHRRTTRRWRSGPAPRMLVCVYPAGQDLDKQVSGKRWKASPATRTMTLLHGVNVPLGLVTNGEQWMLVHAPKGQTTGFISWYADLWLEERLTLRAFTTLLSANRFFSVPSDKTIEKLLADSANDQSEVTDQLGYQVRHAVEVLVQALDVADQDRGGKLLAGISEEKLYEAAVTVMMRLVFLLSAEERHLILSGDEEYSQNYAVSTCAPSCGKRPTIPARSFSTAATMPGPGFWQPSAHLRRHSPRPHGSARLRRRPLRPGPLPLPGRSSRRRELAQGPRGTTADQQPHRAAPAGSRAVAPNEGAGRGTG